MKALKIPIIIFLILINHALFAQIEDLEWSEPFELGRGSAPKMAIDPNNGHLHIVYAYVGLTYYHLEFHDESFIVHNTESVPGAGGESGYWLGGGAIAVDQAGKPHVVYRIHRTFALFDYVYKKKLDSGWSPALSIKTNVTRGFNLDMAIDQSNRVHLSWAEKIDEHNDGFYYRIENYEIVKRQENFAGSRWDNGHGLAISPDGNDVHIVFGQPYIGNSPLSYYYSANAGNSFVLRDNISNSGDNHVRAGHPDIFLDAQGTAHISYGSGKNIPLYVNSEVNYIQYQGANKTRYSVVATAGSNDGDLNAEDDTWFVSDIATDASGKNIAVIYQTNDKSGESYEVTPGNERNSGGTLWVRMSTDYGTNWSDATRLTDNCYMYDGRVQPTIECYDGIFFTIYETDDKIWVRAFPNDSDPDPVADAGGPYTGVEGDTITLDASQSTDIAVNAGIAEFAWDLDFDNNFDILTTEEKYEYIFTDNYTGPFVLRVTDNNNQVDYDTTQADIANIPPQIVIGNDTTVTEGSSIQKTCQISDPGSDLLNCVWRIAGKTIQGTTLNHTFTDNGVFTILAFVQDDDGGEDSDTMIVTVENVAPVADAGGPYTAGIKVPVQFSAQASTDPGINDNLIFEWDLTNDWKYDETGITTTKTYLNTGNYIINLKVTDKDGASDSTTTYVTVSNEKPVISGLTNQTILEDSTFTPILLDDFVNDPDQSAETLTWEVSGQKELIVTLENHILTVTVPEDEWFGKETLNLVVTDAGGLKDSVSIQFQVISVNDPPKWISQTPDTSFNEDDTLNIALSTLKQRVTDIDNTVDELEFSIINNVNLFWRIDSQNQQLKIYPKHNWNGDEILQLKVSDPLSAFDLDTVKFTIIPQPDPPDTFSLVQPLYLEAFSWPDTLHFKWRPATDSDGVSSIIYIWTLEKNNIVISDSSTVKTDLTYITHKSFDYGLYRWYVTAFDQDLKQKQSLNIGFIAIVDSTSSINADRVIPKTFALMQNYPNPFNPETHITYHLPKHSQVNLTVYNQMGQVIKILYAGQQQPGVYTVTFDGKNQNGQPLSSGVYLYKLQTDKNIEIKKMILLQ